LLICDSVSESKPFRLSKNTDRTVQILIAAPVFEIEITAMEMCKILRRKNCIRTEDQNVATKEQ